MKKLFYYILLSCSIVSLTACNDYLDMEPDDRLDEEMVFNDVQRTRGWLSLIYTSLPNGTQTFNRNWGHTYISDDAQIHPGMGATYGVWSRIVAFNQGNYSSTFQMNDEFNFWHVCYKKVRSAYIFLEKVKPLPHQGLTEADVQQMKMEARFLINYFYTKMFELYGTFPLVTKLIPNDTPTNDMMLPQTPVDSIVNYLDKEYVELANFFPAVYTDDAMTGRPTKGMCLALRARLLLYAASPLYNGNTDYKDFKNSEGVNLFPTTYDASKWDRAAKATRELLNLAETGVYELYKEYYKNGEIDPFLSYQNLFITTKGNKEAIFITPVTNDLIRWYNGVANPHGFANQGGYYGSTINLCDAFFMKNGLSPIEGYNDNGTPIINEASGYKETGFATADISYPNTAYDQNPDVKPGVVTVKGCYNMFTNREPRFYVTLWYNNEWIPKAKRYTEFWSGGKDGGPTHDAPVTGVLVRKGCNPVADVANKSVPYQISFILRLGEFYLNYAEALNETDFNGNKKEILKYVNLIRERAGIPIYGDDATLISQGQMVAAPASQEEMRTAIKKEFRAEFGAENDVRYNNIRRWKDLPATFSNPIIGLNTTATKNEAEFYRRTNYQKRPTDSKWYLWPIPQTYIENNPNLRQNPGW